MKKRPKPPKSIMAANIVRMRLAKGWKQHHLAEAADLSVGAIKQIETDISPGNQITKTAIAKALGCTVDDLMQKPPDDQTNNSGAPGPTVQQIIAMLDDRVSDSLELAAKDAEIAELKTQNQKLKADLKALTAKFREAALKPSSVTHIATPKPPYGVPPKSKK